MAARISHVYDAVNQLTSTSYGDGSPSVARAYWPDGKLKTVSTGSGDSWSYTYNALRLLENETFSYAGQSFTFSWGYDGNGSLSYPTGGPVVTYSPNALGEPRSAGAYASSVKFHPNGAVSSYTLGNGIAHSLTQNLRGLPLVNRDAGVMQDQYSYDANGNVTAIADQQEAVFSRAMTYDDLDRLWTANAPGVWGTATYTYDAVDNLRTASVGSRSSTLNYDASNRLSSIVTNGSQTNYGYDARGNISSKGGQSFAFDLGNRLSSASLGGGYTYDGHGRRFRVASSDGSTRLQLYSQAGQILWATSSGGPRPAGSTAYIYLGGKQIAEWASAGNQTQYVHTDALGSPVAHTNSAAQPVVMNRTRYEPYGFTAAGTKPGPNTSSIGFTGHVNDPETDLVYMQQRYYDPIAGRFLSVDPVVTDAESGIGFGRYTYVNNRPYSGTDPDGRFSNDDCRAMGPNCEVLVDSGQGGREPSSGHVSLNIEHSDHFIPKGMTRDEEREGSRDAGAVAIGVAATVVGPELVAARALPWVARLFGATRVVGTAAKEVLPAAAAKIDPGKIREIESIVRSGGTHFPLDTGAQLRAVAESFASKVRNAASPGAAAHIRDVGLGAIDRLDRFKALTPEAVQQLRNIVNGAFKP
ncbi:RHS repeat domain-containing protein [Kinneretia aquatilis]|uniref:RHS repeat domain-containing protein n=1 Tax=Kinneretia aquatilis TaxID=2070761 RepID=UPI00105737FE|nr:RHS repeat-associated core domain-containing protein [Paucibacter aquatile]